MKGAVVALSLAVVTVSGQASAQCTGRVVQLAELNSASLAALDPARTALVLLNGPLEAHGPHLPVAADIYQTEYSARIMAHQLADSLCNWTIVLMPTLWYGVDGANTIPERNDIRGTISLRASTLRAIVADVGSQLADQGFRWVFVVHIHGAAHEHVAISDAADFIHETRGVGMFNIGSLGFFESSPAVDSLLRARFSAADRARIGFDVHAGMWETSQVLAVRPDLVGRQLRALPDVTVRNWEELEVAGRKPAWSGYWSAPALADSTLGRRNLEFWGHRWTGFALRAVRGEDVSKLPRYPDGERLNANIRQAMRSLVAHRTFDAQFQAWLAKRHSIIDR